MGRILNVILHCMRGPVRTVTRGLKSISPISLALGEWNGSLFQLGKMRSWGGSIFRTRTLQQNGCVSIVISILCTRKLSRKEDD